ncbi:MAG: MFS transporter [Novosphingobium sp.]
MASDDPCFGGIVLCSAHGYSLGVMILPIEQEYGWSRAEISAGMLILSLIALVASLCGTCSRQVGRPADRAFRCPFYCTSLAMLSLAGSNVVSWWSLWALLAIANMTVMPAVWLAVLNGYFIKSRGQAMAVALSGTGMGAAIYPFILNALIEWQGWREAYVMLATIAVLLVLPATCSCSGLPAICRRRLGRRRPLAAELLRFPLAARPGPCAI